MLLQALTICEAQVLASNCVDQSPCSCGAHPCNPAGSTLLPTPGRTPRNSLRHNDFQLPIRAAIPAFCRFHPVISKLQARRFGDRAGLNPAFTKWAQPSRGHEQHAPFAFMAPTARRADHTRETFLYPPVKRFLESLGLD